MPAQSEPIMTKRPGRVLPWMRWLLVLPAAFGADLLAQSRLSPSLLVRIWEGVTNHLSPLGPFVDVLSWQAWAPGCFVWAGTRVAPSQRARVSVYLAAFKFVVALSNIFARILCVQRGGSWWRPEDPPIEVPVWWFVGASAVGILVVIIFSATFVLKERPIRTAKGGSRLIIQSLPMGIRLLLSLLAFPPLIWLAILINLWKLHSSPMNTVLLVLPWISSFALSLWIPDLPTRFEAVVLVPLGTTAALLGTIYFFQGAWWVAVWFVLLWLVVGGFGASLHPELSPSRLVEGTISYPNDPEAASLKEMTEREGSQLATVLFKTGLACGISIALLFHHHGSGIFRAGIFGVVAIVLGPVTAFLYCLLTATPLLMAVRRKTPTKTCG